MVYRDNISIKTKFETIDECRENCIDKTGKVIFASSMGKSLIGNIQEDNSFLIGSNQKSVALHEFIGVIVQEEDGIYMKGDIRPRLFSKIFIYFSVLLGLAFGIGMILTWSPVLMIFGLVFMIVPSLNIVFMNKSNALYDKITRKVT